MTIDRLPSALAARALFAAAAAAAPLFAGAPAEAAVILVDFLPRYAVSHSTSVHAANQIPESNLQITSASRSLARFDPSLGVLQSASLRLLSDVAITGAVAAAKDPFVPDQVVVGHGSATATFSGPGFEYSIPTVLNAATCRTTASPLGCSVEALREWRSFDIRHEMDPAALLARPGQETFTIHHGIRNEAAVTRAPTAPSSYFSAATWYVDDLFVAYGFLHHASPSFAAGASQMTLDLDFGSILQGDPAALAFGIFDNAFEPRQSVDFRLVGALGSGDTAALTTDVPVGLDFAAGGMSDFTAFLDSSRVGAFGASYRFDLVETGPGVGHLSHALTLNLRGQVLAAPAAVPEPGAWALMIGGFGLMGAALRRRHRGGALVRRRTVGVRIGRRRLSPRASAAQRVRSQTPPEDS